MPPQYFADFVPNFKSPNGEYLYVEASLHRRPCTLPVDMTDEQESDLEKRDGKLYIKMETGRVDNTPQW